MKEFWNDLRTWHKVMVITYLILVIAQVIVNLLRTPLWKG